MAINHLSDGGPDGWLAGQAAADKGGFFGLTTPIVRPTITVVGTATATTTLNELGITRIHAALRALGLVATDG